MANQAEAIIEVCGLQKEFGRIQAVRGVDLEVRRGEVFGLVGPDGAGKTTILRALCGLLTPTAGSVTVGGSRVEENLDRVRDRIGYMAQRFGLYLDLTVEENMRFYADLFGLDGNKVDAMIPGLLDMTRMSPFASRRAGRLSGGMKQKLALICSLLHEPEILILDEPTNGVDPVSRRDFWLVLHGLVKNGMTVVVSTSYLDEAERCNRVALIYQGRVIVCDSPERLRLQLEEKCFELHSSDLRRAKEVLKSRSGILSVEPAGASLHFFASPSTEIAEITRALEGEGLEVWGVVPIEPSVEDLFIALIRRREGG